MLMISPARTCNAEVMHMKSTHNTKPTGNKEKKNTIFLEWVTCSVNRQKVSQKSTKSAQNKWAEVNRTQQLVPSQEGYR